MEQRKPTKQKKVEWHSSLMSLTVGEPYAHKPSSEKDSTFVVWDGHIFDVTTFLEVHPGGKDLILQHAGQDITDIMRSNDIHKHSKGAYALLQSFMTGSVKKTEPEETVDWDRGMIFQVHKFGNHYMKWVHSPVNMQMRLFNSEFLEFFSKTSWYIVPLFWLPVIFILICHSLDNLENIAFENSTHILLVLLLLVGVFIWTLVEYVLHRFLFHFIPPGDSAFWITLHFFLHGQHHKTPFDPKRLVFPPAAATALALPFYAVLTHVLPIGIGQGIFAGGLIGYLFYDMTHYYLHHGSPPKDSYLHKLKLHHVEHHFVDQNKGFGISSKIWDGPFRTLPKEE